MPENYVEDIGQINAAESQSCNFARRLLKQPGLLLYGLSQFLCVLAVYVPSVYLKEFMNKEREISSIKAGNVITFYGIGVTVGGVISGSIINRFKGRSVFLSGLCTLLLCGICITLAYCYKYWQFCLIMLSYGSCVNGMLALRSLVLIDLCGHESVKESNCFVMFCSGIATLLSPPLVGLLKVKTGTFTYAFICTGGIYMLSSICYIVILVLDHVEIYTRL